MPSPNNCHGLFDHATKLSLLSNIKLKKEEDELLRETRDEVKDVLKAGFKQFQINMKENGLSYELPTPKFYTQGSYAYLTLNDPAYPPEQQADLDYGIYLPFESLLEGMSPKESANTYFELVEQILKIYNKWPINTDKNTCIRITLNERAHMDLPLYGIPASEFKRINEARAAATKLHAADHELESLNPTCVHLALRDGTWKPSDPRLIREWIDATCAAHGSRNRVRAICRYLKAWRDEKWPDGRGGPSSIFLLACTMEHYDHVSEKHHDLLLEVITALPTCLNRPVLVPAPTPMNKNHQEDLRDRLSMEDKAEFQTAFDGLMSEYTFAMTTSNTTKANQYLQRIFGDRLPFDPSRIIRPTEIPPRNKVLNTKARIAPLAMGEQSSGG